MVVSYLSSQAYYCSLTMFLRKVFANVLSESVVSVAQVHDPGTWCDRHLRMENVSR